MVLRSVHTGNIEASDLNVISFGVTEDHQRHLGKHLGLRFNTLFFLGRFLITQKNLSGNNDKSRLNSL